MLTEELVGCMDVLEQIEMYLRPHNPGFVNPHKHLDRVEPIMRAASEEIRYYVASTPTGGFPLGGA